MPVTAAPATRASAAAARRGVMAAIVTDRAVRIVGTFDVPMPTA
jgi:hypothetical protein